MGPKSLIRDSAGASWINAFKRFDNLIVVGRVVAGCRYWIGRSTRRKRDAAGDVRVRPFHGVLYVAELVHKRASGLGWLAAGGRDSGQ